MLRRVGGGAAGGSRRAFPRAIRCGVALAILSVAAPLLGADRHVPAQYPTIQHAIIAAFDGDRILVAPGVYPERIDLLDKELEVIGTAGAAQTTLDAPSSGSAVTIAGGQGASTRIEGLTITGGIGQVVGFPPALVGGGIYIEGAHPTIEGCAILGNTATNGGGAYLDASAARFIDCAFQGNSASEGGALVAVDSAPILEGCAFNSNAAFARGGAIHMLRTPADILGATFTGNEAARGGALSLVDSDVEIIDATIAANIALGAGGGLSLDDFSDVELTDVSILGNTASRGGGLDISHFSNAILYRVEVVGNVASEGGGVRVFESFPLIESCTIRGNDATAPGTGSGEGGGLYLQLRADALIRNTIIAENSAAAGGGLFIRWESEPLLVHATIADNSAPAAGAIGLDNYSFPEIWNSILWGNGPAAASLSTDPESGFDIRSSDVEGGFPGDGIGPSPGNVDVDPLLDPDYRLNICSPVIDLGSLAAPSLPPLDIDGSPRVQGPAPDLGAWESPAGSGHCFVRGDVNIDEAVDLGDVGLSLAWLFASGAPLPCLDAADADDSGAIDIADPIRVLSFLFEGGAPPPPPTVEAAPDPTTDALPCAM